MQNSKVLAMFALFILLENSCASKVICDYALLSNVILMSCHQFTKGIYLLLSLGYDTRLMYCKLELNEKDEVCMHNSSVETE